MGQIKFTKNALREQERHLIQLNRYLPTLQLKKAMLQSEVSLATEQYHVLKKEHIKAVSDAKNFARLLTLNSSIDAVEAVKIERINKRYENIAGVDVPQLDSILFAPFAYTLLDTPPWIDGVIHQLKLVMQKKVEVEIAKEKWEALEAELREVAIRVNLFEKILIPRAKKNTKKIKIFLGDQELAAVSRAKVAKQKIEERKK